LFRNGWLRTGDIGYLDEAGHVVFVGRRLNFTKISGNMVDLKEIEDLVKGLQGVKSARSYVFNEKGREKLSLSIFVTRDFAYTRKEILELCRQNLSGPKIPSQLKIFKSSYDEVNG
jgi:acyl-CoA synthetase (AMP-forming)/AMP-acid ligase II